MLAEPPVVLGRRLKPFSLWHALQLEHLENPYWVGGARPSRADLVVAVCICTTQFKLDGPQYHPAELAKKCFKWGRRHRGTWRDAAKWAEEEDKFVDYLEEFTEITPRWSAGGESLRVPASFGAAVILFEHCNFTEERAWNMGFGLAMAYVAASGAVHGDKSLMAEDELKALAELPDAAEERAKQEKEAKKASKKKQAKGKK